jgi:ergothioneine biosynthesis protein EgtB
MPDASPVKWHLAHTTWFFEQFLLTPFLQGYRPFDAQYDFLFNSYYEAVGPRHSRPARGLLSRPTVAEVCRYRTHVDAQMLRLLQTRGCDARIRSRLELGINHEQQHQELILTDLKHAYSLNPLRPAYGSRVPANAGEARPLRFIGFNPGICEIGAAGDAFHFDNEAPRHSALVAPFALADRLITNAEYREFIDDGGYHRAELWLSDGWAHAQQHRWERPLYWSDDDDAEFTLAGMQPLAPHAPVCHLSYYEADAYARWAGMRLPTEFEWEVAAAQCAVDGNLLDSGRLHPAALSTHGPASSPAQMFGDTWEWTASPYMPYPGFRPLAGALGEYNGKFMCNQMVLRGGSCFTPADHVRATYRNFFYPTARGQVSGLRLARDL